MTATTARPRSETKKKIDVEDGKDQKTEAKSEIRGKLSGMPVFGVKALKMIAASCP